MTSIPIDNIHIGDRYRKDLGNIKNLAKSIREIGLLHPITIDENGTLICGYRRIEAVKLLGMTEIPAYTLNLHNIRSGELAENTVRKDFTCSEMVEIKKYLAEKERNSALHRQKEGRKLGGSIHNIAHKDGNNLLGGKFPQ